MDLESLLTGDRFKASPGKLTQAPQLGGGVAGQPSNVAKEEADNHGEGLAQEASAGASSREPATSATQSPAHPPSPFEEEDSKLESYIAGELPINDYSLNKRFPQGTDFTALSRIRFTLNSYASKVMTLRWYDQMKPPTMTGLLGRLKKYRGLIEGHIDIDIQIGYRQLLARLAALMLMYKACKTWMDTKAPQSLVRLLTPFRVLEIYVHVRHNASMAPDLLLLRSHAIYQDAQAVRGFEWAVCGLCLKSFRKWQADAMAMRSTAMDPAPTAGVDELKDDRIKHVGNKAEEENEKGRRRRVYDYTLPGISDELFLPATVQMCKLVAASLKRLLYRMPALVAWKSVVEDDAETQEFTEVFDGVCVVCRCAWPEESRKPKAMAVRAARKVLSDTLKVVGPVGDVGKAMASDSYKAPELVMELALKHAAAGLEDEASNKRFETSFDRFEELLSGAFDDLVHWVGSANAGGQVDTAFMEDKLACVSTFCNDLCGCMGRWSNAALLEKQEDLYAAFGNILSVLSVSHHTLAQHLLDFVSRLLPVLSSIVAAGGVARKGDAGASGTSEPAAADSQGLAAVSDECASSDNPTNRASLFSISERSVAESLAGSMELGKNLSMCAYQLQDLLDRALARLGEGEARSVVKQGLDALSDELSTNMVTIQKVHSHFADWLVLASNKPHVSGDEFEHLSADGEYMAALTKFSISQNEFAENAISLCVCEDFAGDVILEQLQNNMSNFVAADGALVYDAHARACMVAWADVVVDARVHIAS